jgi:RHS repeat-associated protein
MLRRPAYVYRALILVIAVATMVTLAVGARAGATTVSPRLQPARSSVAADHGAALATRRALVRHKTSASAAASATRRTEARLRRKVQKLTPAQVRAAGAAERRIAAQNAGPLPEQPGSALLNPSVAARSAAQPAASGDQGYVDNLGMTGPSGVVSTACFKVCGLDAGMDSGFVYPGETVTVFGDVWYVTPGTNSTATDQVQVTWTEICDGESFGTLASETVSAEALGNSDPPAEASATFPVTGTCGYEPGEANLSIEMTATVVGGESFGAIPIDAYWGNETLAQLIACSCSPDSAGAAFAQDMVADPVDTASGEYADTFTDATLKSPGFPLSVTRSYSSAQTASGPLGPGWSLPWDASLSINSTTGNVTFTAENGDSYVYTSGSGGAFSAPFGARSVLASVNDSSGSVTGYTLTAPDHHVVRFNASGQLTAEVDATGRGLSFGYNGSGQVSTITDAAGHVVSLTYSGNLLTQLSLPNGNSVQYGYTSGLLTSETDPAGQATDYGYSSGLLATITDADGHEVVHNIYDSSGRVTSQRNGTGDLTAFSYTTSNGLAETDVTDPNGGITTDLYGGGMLLESIDPPGNATEYSYNGYGQQVEVTDPMGNATTMAYDGSGNLIRQTDPLGDQQSWVYDSDNNLLTYTSADDDSTTYTYNGMDEVTSITNQSGGETTNGYDSAGNLISSTDPRGNASGANPAAYQTTYAYDPAGLLQKVTNPGGGVTSYTYDAEGNVLTKTDPMNRVIQTGYDADERATSITAPDGGIQKSGYDPAGNLVSQADPDGNSYTYKYDADDRLSQAIDPLGNSVSYGYDGNGNQTSFTDARDIITTTTFNADDQPLKVSYSDGTPGVSYVYDADGNATKVTDGSGTRTMVYNAANQLTSQAGPGSGSFGYGYDAAGNVTSRQYPDGTKVAYTYNNDGQVASLATGSATTSYSYNAAGNLVSTTEPGGVTESRSYDGAGQVTGIGDAKGSTTLDSYGLTLNADGQPTQVATTQNGAAQATQYDSYDSTGRLASACYSATGSGACSAGSAGTASGSAADPAAQSGAVTSGEAGLCLDDAGDSGTAGNKIDVATCTGAASQTWAVAGNSVQIAGGCLAVASGGTSTVLEPCATGSAAQQWQAGTGSTLVNPVTGKCLDDPGGSTTSGTQADIAACTGSVQQEWGQPGTSSGWVTNGVTGECANDSGSGTTAGTKVTINTCNTTAAAQQWAPQSNGTIQIHSLCLEPAGAGTTQSTGLVLEPCSGISAQHWLAGPDGWVWNVNSGMCLSDPNASTTNGTQLVITPCTGATQQTWRLPPLRPSAGTLANNVAGECADNSGNTKAVIWACNSTAAQQWVDGNDANIRTVSGLCLTLTGGATVNNTPIALATCASAADQEWAVGPDGWILSTDSDLCLSDNSASTTNGTQLIVAACNGSTQQHWGQPPDTAPWAPRGVTVTAGAGSATVSWTPVSTGGDALSGYTVTASPGGVTASVGPYATSATVSGLTAGTAYTFTVTATSAAGSTASGATTAVTPGNETSYSYDQAGNLTGSETDGLTTTSSYNADEELTKAVTGSATTAYGYDADGDQTSAGNQAYTYNALAELATTTTAAGTFSYGYDSSGNLTTTSLNGSKVQGTVWDTNNSLPLAAEDTSASGATTADYVYQPNQQLADVTSGGSSYTPVSDWLGSVTGLLSSSGSQVSSTAYGTYGTASVTALSSGTPLISLGYAGSYTVPGVGLDDMRARDYNPAEGAFTTVDPMLTSTGQACAYAGDAPVNATDPSGEMIPASGGGSLTIQQIIDNPWVLEGMNPEQLIDALGGVPPGFEVSVAKGSRIMPGWKLTRESEGGLMIKWGATPRHLNGRPNWKVTGGRIGKKTEERIPAGDWPDGPSEYTQFPGSCEDAYTGVSCGPGDSLWGDDGDGDGFFGDELPGFIGDVGEYC